MSPKGLSSIIWLTLLTWVPVIVIIHPHHSHWGMIIVKVIAGLWLVSALAQIAFGNTAKTVGSARAGFLLNTVWFIILNLDLYYWTNVASVLLIATGLFTCYKIIKASESPHSETFGRDGK